MIVNRPKKKKRPSRYNIFLGIMGIIFTVIISKLVYVQLYKHDDYKDQADTTATRFISEKAPRGIIYDANGNILATNQQTYTIKYTTTTEADKHFFNTIDSVLSILSQNSESFQDDLALKLDNKNEPYFQFTGTDETTRKAQEVRFKRDRGLNEDIENELYDGKTSDLTDDQINAVNEKLMDITPKEVFYYLVKSYNLINLIDPEPEDEKLAEHKAYEERVKNYKDMSGEEITKLLLDKYSYSQLRTYIVVKDALKMESFKGYKSVAVTSNIKKDTALIIMQKLNDLPGIDVSLEPIRSYPYNELASSVLGYISPIDTLSKDKYELRGYDSSTDLIGVSGIESSFEDQLKGVKGGTTVKVNSKGRVTEEMFQLQTYPGNNVHLTIDKNIQYAAEQSLIDAMTNIRAGGTGEAFPGATRGAAIAVEVKTGRILASVSYPNYDPNKFAISGQLTDKETKEYFSPDLEAFGKNYIKSRGLSKTVDDLFPKSSDGVRTDPYDLYPKRFYNYATQGLLPPGSTFKPITGIAGMQEGVVKPNETIVDKGIFKEHPDVYGKSFGPECLIYSNSGGSQTHGAVDVSGALEVSCNYYFYEVAYRLYKNGGQNISALDAIAKYAWKFGLGVDPNGKQKASTGIEIEENFGQVYNFESYKNNAIAYSKYDLRDFLEAGYYAGNGNKFVPFDYSDNEDDSEKLKKAKTSLKSTITEAFKTIGTSNEVKTSELEKNLLDDVKTIMDTSDKYKENVKNYESSGKGKVDVNAQAKLVVQSIAKFVISDRGAEIKSPGQQVYSAIGQGMNAFTPMQMAQYVSTLANGGTKYKLHYVDKITDPDGNVVQEYKPEALDKVDIKPEVYKAILEGMKKVNNDEDGTAKATWNGYPIETAGKTGTADFGEKQTDYGRAPYAPYVSFAPADNPEIAVVAVAYDGGHGGSVAPVAKAIYDAYFKDRLPKSYTSSSASFKKYVVDAQTKKPDNKTSK
ncbi:penicillin-binding transpeptidase domain-containing protein [Clostridium sp. SHJSY1]|uniref:peptidoglycan D,D-transpeptidase FtsI family protein n=1 Tax=Clostridium sp. SHJSY1 TaxID=2942483 RepID=UPI00287463C6|nr:penicillin-binding transpeptidase domain-containing protein [Clostridium sp. SHJSY1]MDS0528017.1 penicillin-binding transpeptidase domain-containing protein [Clostridium sp. SHJSY1]